MSTKVSVDEIGNIRSIVGHAVLSILSAGTPEESAATIGKVMAACTVPGEYDIKLTINGLEFDVRPFFAELERQLNTMIANEAVDMIKKYMPNADKIMSITKDIEIGLKEAIRKDFPNMHFGGDEWD